MTRFMGMCPSCGTAINIELELKQEGVIMAKPQELPMPPKPKPSFRIGDRIFFKENGKTTTGIITDIEGNAYKVERKKISIVHMDQVSYDKSTET